MKLIVLLLGLIPLSLQVHVYLIESQENGQVISWNMCRDIEPGVCCRTPTHGAWFADITNLGATDIAAVFEQLPGREPSGCAGRVLASQAGPGHWNWGTWYNQATWVRGASYIRLPTRLPIRKGQSDWLAAQGMLGLIWDKGSWYASEAASSYINSLKLDLRRDVRSPDKGQVYAMPPPRVAFPDRVGINGTNYTAVAESPFMYKDDITAAVVNLTSYFS